MFILVTCSKDKGTTSELKPSIGLSTSEIHFSLAEFDPQPAPRMVVVSNAGQAALNCGLSKKCDWLGLSLSATQLNPAEAETIFVTVHPAGKLLGVYVDSIVLTDAKAANSPQYIAVVLEITRALKPVIAVSSEQLSFYSVRMEPSPAPQTLKLYNTGGDTLRCTASKKADWLSFDMPSTNLRSGDSLSVLVSVNSSGKAVGIYRDTILLEDNAAANSPYKVPVLLTVEAQSTLIIMDSLSSSWTYDGVLYENYYFYTLTSNWRMRCYSNCSKSVEVFAYVASDTFNTGLLGQDESLTPFTLSPGSSRDATFAFPVYVAYYPPPFEIPWLIWVKYRVDGVEYFTKALVVPGPSTPKRATAPGKIQPSSRFSHEPQGEIIR
ncbi:MAG: hypothetical protein E4G91_08100 [Candidatus Zixiibacteriota bacterium]|nr:MAG: hypothetical protein E4G91_08100 [candidate division Zixibacteria bacterium]